MRRFLGGFAVLLTLLPAIAAAQVVPQPWQQVGPTASLSVSNSSSSVKLGWATIGTTPPIAERVCNTGTVAASVAFGDSTVVATTANFSIPPGTTNVPSCVVLAGGSAAYIAAITSSGTTTLTISSGSGWVMGSGPGGGGAAGGMSTDASNAVLPDARTNLGLGTASTPTFAGLSLNPTASSLNPGLLITQSLAGSSGFPAGDAMNLVDISSDNAALGGAEQYLNHFEVSATIGGSSMKGGRSTLASFLTMTAPSSASNLTRNYQAATFGAKASSGDNGTDTGAGALGAIFGSAPYAQLLTGATNWAEVSGEIIAVGIQTGASSHNKYGLHIAYLADDAVQGAGYDAMIALSGSAGMTAGGKNGILIGDMDGAAPLSTSACIFCTTGTGTVGKGVDLSGYTISGVAFASTGFSVKNGAINTSTLNVQGAGSLSLASGYNAQIQTTTNANLLIGPGSFFSSSGIALLAENDALNAVQPINLVGSTIIIQGAFQLGSSTTGSSTQTFTNSPCSTLTTERWVPIGITGQSGTWYIPTCQ